MYFVTGATGHIGNVLVRTLLDRGHRVRALILPGEDTRSLDGLAVEQMAGDILDPGSLEKPLQGIDCVFHLAGMISILPGRQEQVWRVNVEGTRNILDCVRRAGIRRLVYTSSIHAIHPAPQGIIDESLPYDPVHTLGEYDKSKATATLEVQRAAAEGLDAVIVCPTGVIGPYDYRGSLMGSVIQAAAFCRPTPYVDGAYDFVDVRDVAGGLAEACERGTSGTSYILSGQRVSVRYLLETVREITGRAFPHFKIPFNLARFAARFTPLYYHYAHAVPRFTPYSLEVLKSNSHISHARASRELDYRPRSLYDSVRDTVQWLFEQRTRAGVLKG